jgi:hypothetical protein
MGLAYADIRKNRPLLDFGQVHLQNSLRRGQGSTYISLHILYHSTLVRARVRAMTNARNPIGGDKDPAITVIATFHGALICSNDALHREPEVSSI